MLFHFPVFLNTPDALNWVKSKDWLSLILVTNEKDAVRFVKQLSPQPVPIWKVEMRVSYLDPISQREGAKMATHMGVHPEMHDPSDAWDSGKWEIGFEAYVGGTRWQDYGDKKWQLIKP